LNSHRKLRSEKSASSGDDEYIKQSKLKLFSMLNDDNGKLKILKALETDLKKVPLTLQVSKDLISEASRSN